MKLFLKYNFYYLRNGNNKNTFDLSTQFMDISTPK